MTSTDPKLRQLWKQVPETEVKAVTVATTLREASWTLSAIAERLDAALRIAVVSTQISRLSQALADAVDEMDGAVPIKPAKLIRVTDANGQCCDVSMDTAIELVHAMLAADEVVAMRPLISALPASQPDDTGDDDGSASHDQAVDQLTG